MTILHEFVGARSEKRRDREKERELGRRTPRQAEQHAADDRCARARRAGNQRQRLRASDAERVGPPHRVDVVDTNITRPALLSPFGPQDDERADDERERDRDRREQHRFDELAEQQT